MAIADNGVGIESEYLAEIFKPLVRLHNASEYPGTGLGLTLARKAVLAQKGSIWCVSIPGHGAGLLPVRLPAAKGRPWPPKPGWSPEGLKSRTARKRKTPRRGGRRGVGVGGVSPVSQVSRLQRYPCCKIRQRCKALFHRNGDYFYVPPCRRRFQQLGPCPWPSVPPQQNRQRGERP